MLTMFTNYLYPSSIPTSSVVIHEIIPRNSKDSTLEQRQFEVAKAYCDHDPVPGFFRAIVINKKKECKDIIICSVKYDSIKDVDKEINFYKQLKLGTQVLAQDFSDNPSILLKIFKRQLQEYGLFLSGKEHKMKDALIESKIHYLVAKVYGLLNRLELDWRSLSIPSKLLERFPFLTSPVLDSTLGSHVLEFFDESTRRRYWQELSGEKKWDLFAKYLRSDSKLLASEFVSVPLAIIDKCVFFDIDELSKSNDFQKRYKEKTIDSKELKNRLSHFTNIEKIEIGSYCTPDFITDIFVPCVQASQKKVDIDFADSHITDPDIFFITRKLNKLNFNHTKITGRCLAADCMKSVRSLSFVNCSGLQEKYLQGVELPSLKFLDLSSNVYFTGESLKYSIFKPLKQLVLNKCVKITDKELEKLSCLDLKKLYINSIPIAGTSLSNDVFHSLTHLSLKRNQVVTDLSLSKVSANELIFLDVSETKVTGAFLQAEQFKNLFELNLRSCTQLKLEELQLYTPKNLKILDLSGIKITAEWFLSDIFKNLGGLHLSENMTLRDTIFEDIVLPNLKFLDLGNSPITGDCFQYKFFNSIEELYLDGKEIDWKNLLSFKGKNLKKLSLNSLRQEQSNSYCNPNYIVDIFIPSVTISERNQPVANFSRSRIRDFDILFTQLKFHDVNLFETQVNGSFLRADCMRTVERLVLSSCPELDEEKLQQKDVVLPSLKFLDLSFNSKFTGDSFKFPFFKPVKQLVLNNCSKISDKQLASLSCFELQELYLDGVPIVGTSLAKYVFNSLTTLSLEANDKISDMSLRDISSGNLKFLNVSKTSCTGEFLHKKQFEGLSELHLNNCKELHFLYLQKYLPSNLQTLHIGGNQITPQWLKLDMFQKLTRLYLSGTRVINDEFFQDLGVLPKLKLLDLSKTLITGKCFEYAFFDLIEELHLNETQVDLKNLLLFRGKKLKKLHLSSDAITGSEFKDDFFLQLDVLDLSRCKNLNKTLIPKELEKIIKFD